MPAPDIVTSSNSRTSPRRFEGGRDSMTCSRSQRFPIDVTVKSKKLTDKTESVSILVVDVLPCINVQPTDQSNVIRRTGGSSSGQQQAEFTFEAANDTSANLKNQAGMRNNGIRSVRPSTGQDGHDYRKCRENNQTSAQRKDVGVNTGTKVSFDQHFSRVKSREQRYMSPTLTISNNHLLPQQVCSMKVMTRDQRRLRPDVLQEGEIMGPHVALVYSETQDDRTECDHDVCPPCGKRKQSNEENIQESGKQNQCNPCGRKKLWKRVNQGSQENQAFGKQIPEKSYKGNQRDEEIPSSRVNTVAGQTNVRDDQWENKTPPRKEQYSSTGEQVPSHRNADNAHTNSCKKADNDFVNVTILTFDLPRSGDDKEVLFDANNPAFTKLLSHLTQYVMHRECKGRSSCNLAAGQVSCNGQVIMPSKDCKLASVDEEEDEEEDVEEEEEESCASSRSQSIEEENDKNWKSTKRQEENSSDECEGRPLIENYCHCSLLPDTLQRKSQDSLNSCKMETLHEQSLEECPCQYDSSPCHKYRIHRHRSSGEGSDATLSQESSSQTDEKFDKLRSNPCPLNRNERLKRMSKEEEGVKNTSEGMVNKDKTRWQKSYICSNHLPGCLKRQECPPALTELRQCYCGRTGIGDKDIPNTNNGCPLYCCCTNNNCCTSDVQESAMNMLSKQSSGRTSQVSEEKPVGSVNRIISNVREVATNTELPMLIETRQASTQTSQVSLERAVQSIKRISNVQEVATNTELPMLIESKESSTQTSLVSLKRAVRSIKRISNVQEVATNTDLPMLTENKHSSRRTSRANEEKPSGSVRPSYEEVEDSPRKDSGNRSLVEPTGDSQVQEEKVRSGQWNEKLTVQDPCHERKRSRKSLGENPEYPKLSKSTPMPEEPPVRKRGIPCTCSLERVTELGTGRESSQVKTIPSREGMSVQLSLMPNCALLPEASVSEAMQEDRESKTNEEQSGSCDQSYIITDQGSDLNTLTPKKEKSRGRRCSATDRMKQLISRVLPAPNQQDSKQQKVRWTDMDSKADPKAETDPKNARSLRGNPRRRNLSHKSRFLAG